MKSSIKLEEKLLFPEQLFDDPVKKLPQSLLCSVRILIALLSLMGTSIMYITRVNLNIAILAMVKTDISTETNYELQQSSSPLVNLTSPIVQIDPLAPMVGIPATTSGEFDWSPPEQGIMLGSFFYGLLWATTLPF